ncbi:G patch domain and ankyrin repeat-containing protein 1 homolog [Chironomus tepperi]|uniref:G patch domain and ankyrin repeat-containing protein 1 homolog n=1 Tax=Chironomus tepperi TaxID=113505 RepID=UPI00391FC578
MEENDELSDNDVHHLHANWRALASVHFKPKIFIKSSGTENQQIVKSEEVKYPIENVQSSEFYQEVLNMPSTSNTNPIKIEKTRTAHSIKKEKIQKVPFCKQKLFRLALNNDPEGIDNLIKTSSNVDINAVDNFGWTALMISACEGSIDSFRSLLINHNASLDFKDRTGNTALSLATKNNHSDILNIIEEYNSKNSYSESSDEEVEEQNEGTLYCPDCKIKIKKSSSKSHQSSTVHLFSCKYNTDVTIKSFGIAHSNKGFKLMKTIGWDGNSALGARKNGKMYPVKTVMRKGRTGLGVKQDDPKITHFKANDVSAVHFKSQPPALTRKEIIKQSLKEKRHEQMLRRELS